MIKLNLLIVLIAVIFPLTVAAQSFWGFESSINTFPQKIQSPQSNPIPAGTYTIGTSGDFPSIDSAFNKLSIDGIAGSVTLELTDNMYSAPTTDYGFLLDGPIPGADQNNRVTLRPAPNKTVTIEGNGGCVLCFLNTSYLTIDGISLNGDTTLTIHSIYNNQYTHNQPVSFFDNSDHDEVINLNVIDGDNTYQASPIGFFVTNSSSSSVPDSNLVEDNLIIGGSIGAVVVGVNSLYKPTGNEIIGNFIGSETDSLKSWGLFLEYCKNTLVAKNLIQNLRRNNNNESATYGIQVYGSENTDIYDNIIHNVYNESGSNGAFGIVLTAGSGNLVYNNMIYDIRSSSAGLNLVGIILNEETNPKIYYNSVYLYGGDDFPNGSSDLIFLGDDANITLKNNILVNTRDDSPHYSYVITDYTTSNITSNYNDLYCASSPYNFLVGILNTQYDSLAFWQTTGEDSLSISEMPNFVSPDLHIDPSITTNLESHATPISGIEKDIDGDLRNSDTPDIGSDEFDGFIPTAVELTTEIPKHFSLSQNYPNPFNPMTTINYSIQSESYVSLTLYNELGQRVANLVNGNKKAGEYQVSFDASSLSSGIYIYRLKAGNYSAVKKMVLLK